MSKKLSMKLVAIDTINGETIIGHYHPKATEPAVAFRDGFVHGSNICPNDPIRPVTKADTIKYNKAKGAKYTPYARIKEAVRTIHALGYTIDDADYDCAAYPDEVPDELYNAIHTLEWAGFRTKEEFLFMYQIPSFAYCYERKLLKK